MDSDSFWESTGELIKTINDDIARARTELAFFIGAVAFILLTTLGIDDHALLIGTRIKLPVFGVSASLYWFLCGSPALLICIHLVLLLKFRKLREKCSAIETRLCGARKPDPAIAKVYRLRVTSNFFTDWNIGRGDNVIYRRLNIAIYASCLYFAPIVTLLFLMLRTLPLHDNTLTTSQSVMLFWDIWISLYVLRSGRIVPVTLIATAITIFFALLLSVPDGWQDRIGRDYLISATVPFGKHGATRRAFWPTAFFLESEVDPATGHPVRLMSRNIVVVNDARGPSEYDAAPDMSSDHLDQSAKQRLTPGRPLSLSGRNLRYATLNNSSLREANLLAADLTGASLWATDLTGAYFGCAARYARPDDEVLAAARTKCTKFDGANLYGASLARVASHTTAVNDTLYTTSFAGVDLSFADLTGADIPFTSLDRANLEHAVLAGANLSYASLVSADLTSANLAGATLSNVDATLAAFGNSILAGADLSASRLDAANFENADLTGADFTFATLWGTSLRNANVWGAVPPHKNDVPLADLSNLRIEAPTEPYKQQLDQLANWLVGGRQFPGVSRLSMLAAHFRNKEEQESGNSSIWEIWSKSLMTDMGAEYQTAAAQLITAIGCQNAKYAAGIAKWSGFHPPAEMKFNDAIERLGFPPPLEVMPRPTDPRLDKIWSPPTEQTYTWGHPTFVINPLPSWYKLSDFVGALKNPKSCRAGALMPPEFISTLKANSAGRETSASSR